MKHQRSVALMANDPEGNLDITFPVHSMAWPQKHGPRLREMWYSPIRYLVFISYCDKLWLGSWSSYLICSILGMNHFIDLKERVLIWSEDSERCSNSNDPTFKIFIKRFELTEDEIWVIKNIICLMNTWNLHKILH